jgi:hypothetical protein
VTPGRRTLVGQAGQLAEQLGGELTIATAGPDPAGRLLLWLPLAALPEEVWPDQPPFPAADTPLGVSYN